MKATIKDFFGSNLEQEVLDKVVILPQGEYSTGYIFTLPDKLIWADFEEVYIELGLTSNPVAAFCGGTFRQPLSGLLGVSYSASTSALFTGGIRGLSLNGSSGEVYLDVGDPRGRVRRVVGYKRRISRVGIDELMSAMCLPNLIANADLTDNPINQRGFDGNWAALAVGTYGYDQWVKVSSTHMGAVIEAGKYRPSTKHTFTKDDVVIGEFMSPASGHWSVAVPFATSGKFDLYAGQFKRPWHPVLDGEKRCREHYQTDTVRQSGSSYASGYIQFASSSFAELMRKIPDVTYTDLTLSPATGWTEMTSRIYATRNNVSRIVRNTTLAGASSYIISDIVADASITLEELNGQIIYLQ
uniref:Uncharacterized protein n=1 Tax=Enterovibrio sp. FF_113 TaxID=1660266 RepID=A0A0H3ZRF4_9GAMM|nr:hypothetical protein [Enterovibrio sp. FF_113]